MTGQNGVHGTRVRIWSLATYALAGFCWAASSLAAQSRPVTSPTATAAAPTATPTSPPVTCVAPAVVAGPVTPGKVVVASGGDVATKSNAKVRQWTVQVASFESMSDAQTMQQSLCQHGFEARVVGASRPYVVRVGRFPTSQDAMVIARHLSAPKRMVFVTQAER